jgi:aminoglycoside phosphotransferase (APT) family kinase protein
MLSAMHELEATLRALEGGTPYKAALEALLLALAPDAADALMLLLKESRGAFALLAPAPRKGSRALFVGDARSGTVVALAMLGHRVTVVDTDPWRLVFALARGRAYDGRTTAVRAGADERLPFVDAAFDLVVQEGGLPGPRTGFGHGATELRRVARATLVVTADNRFGYKRSTGHRGQFVRDPRVLVREALVPARGERGLFGTRRAVQGNWPAVATFSLYPHAREFSHVVALDAPGPRLTVGRRERQNVLKVVGKRLGLFPLLTPSFAVIAGRERGPRLVDWMLDDLAQRIGEPRPTVDVVIATRSNDAILHTALAGADPEDPRGRWTLHVPLQPGKERMVRVHHDWLVELRAVHPAVPVPEPLYLGPLGRGPAQGNVAESVDRPTVAVERRLPGMTGADLTGDRAATARMFHAVVDAFVRLVKPDAPPLDAARFDVEIGARAELVLSHVPRAATRRALQRLVASARERMLGRPMPSALYHADLRAKHVAVRDDGSLVGFLDWGASERSCVPYVDVLHLVLHQRKQEEGCTLGAAAALVGEPGRLREHERATLDRYCAALDLDVEIRRGIELLYPVFAAAMAERNWDYSRPDWVHRHFGL